MAKKTLLQITQDILSDISGDQVNSITTTTDSEQVARIVISCYEDIMNARAKWPHLRTLFTLDSAGDSSKPTHLLLPSNIKELELVKYDCKKAVEDKKYLKDIKYLPPEDFLDKVNNYDTTKNDVQEVTDYSGVTILIKNDEHPSCWTSFDDTYMVFNSFYSNLDSSLQSNKTQCLGYRNASIALSDDSIPDLPEDAFPTLIAESKSAASIKLKQIADPFAEKQAVRQRNSMSRNSFRAHGGITYPNYGRRGKK